MGPETLMTGEKYIIILPLRRICQVGEKIDTGVTVHTVCGSGGVSKTSSAAAAAAHTSTFTLYLLFTPH